MSHLRAATPNRREVPIHERQRPRLPSLRVKGGEQFTPDTLPDATGLPLAEATPAGDRAAKAAWQVAPAAAVAQHEKNAVERAAIIRAWPPDAALRRDWQQWTDA